MIGAGARSTAAWALGRTALGALAALLVGAPPPAAAQDAAIQGIVADSSTGWPLEGVAVTLFRGGEQAYHTFTDRNGFYQLPVVAPGTYALRGELIGFRPHEEGLALAAGERRTVSFRLNLLAVELEGIVVSPARGAAVKDLGRQVVTPEDLRMVPVPAGVGDLATYLQTLPGVTTTGDRGGQLFVRGGTPADNLVLVDGIPIYQPFHVLGFFSVFPEDLVSRADFYAGGFGARYHGRTASVLDVRMRDGDPNGFRSVASAGPFVAEAVAEGPTGGATWLTSVRRSLVEETSGALMGTPQPLTFESQLVKITSTHRDDDRCSALGLRTADRGRMDPEERDSYVSWSNLLFGFRCVRLREAGQLLEVQWSYSRSASGATTRGASRLSSSIWRVNHNLHATGSLGSVPVQAGYELYLEATSYDLTELFSDQVGHDDLFGVSAYGEVELPVGDGLEVRPGVVLVVSPSLGVEPRLRASWQPFGRAAEEVQAAVGLYRQHLVGTSDIRDVNSVFVAWMEAPDGVPKRSLHATLGWQQSLGGGFRWSLDGYWKRMSGIPVPIWRAVARYTTGLGRADGLAYGADLRLEYATPRFHGFLGYGYTWTEYEMAQREFSTWFGEPVQMYHPPHDRRHQVNAVGSLELGHDVTASVRWQLGTGLPFTRPMGFDEDFDYARRLYDVNRHLGTTRIILDRPFRGRLPVVHRLDVSLQKAFGLSFGELRVQAGVINAYDRRNMFFYDLYTGRRLDQLPLAPYAAVTLEAR